MTDPDLPADLKETELVMQKIAEAVDLILNGPARGHDRKNAFVLLIAPFTDKVNENGLINYISNAEREDVKGLLQDMVNQWDDPSKHGPDIGGGPRTEH